ncbi:helix-turn-helix transcriptional regulator [Couchioplanes caeruleus]|uniref:HTH luxR-type domain-containing protein n=2 Tax=Couchioplanes caeruleus TaxID=56438 RepID=A0A1K0FQG4_9ACTN|nr:helix-turn-helix transcriptional regulator [Couchioplanes caeruleus]OJF15071.1 hypothetical protein BG844_06355 [Couchioplanes caeruleus subsp. caeruleus]ROP33940.1 regulatory LuxR family protein [Couchioplanes caeruleus]
MPAAAQACHVQALSMSGRLPAAAEAAERYYADAVMHGSPAGSTAGNYVALGEAWLLAMSGQVPAAVDLLRATAERFLAQGAVAVAVDALHLRSRLEPGAETASELRGFADLTDSPLFGWYADYAEAMAANHPGRLEQLSAVWEERHYLPLALEAAVRAAQLSGRAGRTTTRLSRRIEESRRSCDGFWPAWLDPHEQGPTLTQRERQVCRLAVDGLGNPEIAHRLVLSVRTVENHQQRGYQKLGIRGRQELASALPSP